MTEFKVNMVEKPNKRKFTCPVCGGDGKIMEYEGVFTDCPQCFGKGEIELKLTKGKKKDGLEGLSNE